MDSRNSLDTIRGAAFTVGTWTLVTPFLIVTPAPVAALLIYSNKKVFGFALLAVLAVDSLFSCAKFLHPAAGDA